MKNIKTWIVKNKIITSILLAAVVLALGIILAFSQAENSSTQELAAQGQNSSQANEMSGENSSQIQSIAQLQSNEPEASEESCTSLHGSCTDDATLCDARYIDAAGCIASFDCCVPLGTVNDCEEKAPIGFKQQCIREGCSGEWRSSNAGSCGNSEASCCVRPIETSEPEPTEEPDNGETDPVITSTPTPTPNTKNTCNKEVTCTQCNTPCSEGDPRMCQTCSTSDNSCSFRQACGNSDDDPIYKSTCGKGDFTDDTRQQREEGAQGYTHVKCTGTSVCTGGPNADGLYWCVEEVDPTQPPGENCSVEYKEKAPCDTKCGTYFKCGSQEEFKACAEASSCALITPTEAPDQSPPSGSDTGTLPAVQVTAQPGSCGGHIKISWTATSSNTSNGYWLYRGTTQDFKPTKDNNIAGNINPNKTADSPYYDWLSEPGKLYYYRVIASGTQGNTKWSNAAASNTSTACGSNVTPPSQGGPGSPNNPGGGTNPAPGVSPDDDYMTNCSAETGRGRNCACSANSQCTNGWCNGGKCHYAPTTTQCPATGKPQACVCETNAQCTSGWCNGGKCN